MDAFAWCRERMLVPGQPLMASLPFAEASDQKAILAIRTLGSELLGLATGPPEPALLNARVNWWRGALTGQAEHPALTALAESNCQSRVAPTAFLPLLASLESAASQPRFERFEELCQHGGQLGGKLAALEYRLKAGSADGAGAATELGTAGWLLRRVRDIAHEARLNCWLVPLDLQAQFQVARQDVLDARGGPGWHGLIRTLVTRALAMGEGATVRLGPEHRHLLIHWAVEKRLAAMMAGRPERILRERLLSGHAGNVWVAWRAARKLQRRTTS